MIEEVRERTNSIISRAVEADDPVLVQAPPAAGKTHNAVQLAQEYCVTYLTNRTDLYEQAEELANRTDGGETPIEVEVIPSPYRDCPTFAGENDGDEREAKRLYAKGVSGAELHHGSAHDVSMPCHRGGSVCDYVEKRERIQTDPATIDLLVGNHQHAYAETYLDGRVVVFDEFNPDPFLQRFPDGENDITDSPGELVREFFQSVDEIPLEDVTHLVEARTRQDEAYERTLDWFREHGATKETAKDVLDISSYRYNSTHKIAPLLACSLLVMERLGPGFGHAHDADLWEDVGLNPDTSVIRDRNTGEMMVLDPPRLDAAQQVIGLGALPVKPLWEHVVGCDFVVKRVLDDDQLDEYLSEGLELEVRQLTDSRNPYASGRVSPKDRQRFAVVRAIENQRFPLISTKQALEKYATYGWIDGVVDTAETESRYRVQNYATVLSSNRFEEDRLGVVSGNPYPGDHVVQQWAALCGEFTEPLRGDDCGADEATVGEETNCSSSRLEFSTELGDRIYRHFTHDQVFQAIMRFGRSTGEEIGRSRVYINTSTVPEWLSPRKLRVKDAQMAEKEVAIIESLIEARRHDSSQSWQTVSSLTERVEDRLPLTEIGDGSVSTEKVRNTLKKESYDEYVEVDPNRGWNGADCYRWTSEDDLTPIEGSTHASHILSADHTVLLLRLT